MMHFRVLSTGVVTIESTLHAYSLQPARIVIVSLSQLVRTTLYVGVAVSSFKKASTLSGRRAEMDRSYADNVKNNMTQRSYVSYR
jgi:hypothetical protein